jgi:two-component system, chemotaxis family, chemotaxis protein CheY
MQSVEAKDVDFNRLRFLIVDDNQHMRRILRTLLHSFGAREVHEAEDGASGLEAYSNHGPDVVLLDWVMPIFDGLELTQMIRQPDITTNPFVPIILLTAHTGKRRILAARDAGVTEVLAKPISAKSLHDRIIATVSRPRKFVRTENYFGPEHRRELKPLASDMLGLPYRASMTAQQQR